MICTQCYQLIADSDYVRISGAILCGSCADRRFNDEWQASAEKVKRQQKSLAQLLHSEEGE